MPKKGKNIYKRKDGRWEARYVKGYEPSGKIKYGSCYGKTYKEAQKKVERVKAALMNSVPVPAKSKRRSLSFFCDEWLLLQKERVKESTYIKYNTIVERHIKPMLGECFPQGIDSKTIEAFKKSLVKESKLSASTVKGVLVVLRLILRYVSKQSPGAGPMAEIICPRVAKKEARVLSVEEQKRLISYLCEEIDPCRFGILLTLLTGIRIGELCALQWGDVSLKSRTIRIKATMQRLKKVDGTGAERTQVVIGEPKSETSSRTIPMSESAVRLCRRMASENRAAFILTGTEAYMEPRTLQYRFKKYTDECGLEGVHFHTLRHTFATRCVEVGFELKSLSEILGHSSTAITMDRYVHSSMSLKRDNMDKLAIVGL